MSDIAVRVQNLSKSYTITRLKQRHDTLRDQLAHGFRSVLSGLNRSTPVSRDGGALQTIWALKDVSFDVRHGEVLGIVGRNGAGKSTLLKMLSRISAPTAGRAEIHGRLGSLLEVGTGFHPELTGRENIYLNGAVLGMRRSEIARRFDEIVAFSEIEKFIDTPVKRYSSGMYVRLAFAVAAHLELETLVVDEVLAVGDLAFQTKCLGKMGEVAREGRTIILVSHNMGAIDRLCNRAVLLEHGRLCFEGSTADAIRLYQTANSGTSAEWRRVETYPANHDCSFLRITVHNALGRVATVFEGDEAILVEIDYVVHRRLDPCQIGARILTPDGTTLFGTEDVDGTDAPALAREPGHYRARFTIPGHLLRPGRYSLMVGAHSPHRKWYELIENAAEIDVSPVGSLASDRRTGTISPLIRWDTSRDRTS
jgi:lipopolysaccharide transport system ATP-binding protein